MADSKVQNLTAASAFKRTDVLFGVVDPGGTPLDRKITGSLLRPYYDFVQDFGADPTFATDNCAALQSAFDTIAAAGAGILYVPAGRYKFSGALQNTGTDNAQVIIPTVAMTASQVTISVVGAAPAPSNFDLIGGGTPYPVPSTGYSIFESTLTGASGTASFIGAADHGSDFQANNLQIRFANMIFVAPANPTFTMLDLRFQYSTPELLKDCLIHASRVDIKGMTQPTNSNAYGVKQPGNNQGAQGTINGLTIMGFWIGMLQGECMYVDNYAAWSCVGAVETVFTFHPWCYWHIAVAWCTYGFVGGSSAPVSGSNVTYGRVGLMDIEHANSGGGEGAAWQDTIADVYDPADYLHLHIDRWFAVQAGVGNDHTFTKNSGANVTATELV